jgi:hypothetical protein
VTGSIVKGERISENVMEEMMMNTENWRKVFRLVKRGGDVMAFTQENRSSRVILQGHKARETNWVEPVAWNHVPNECRRVCRHFSKVFYGAQCYIVIPFEENSYVIEKKDPLW